ncbi:sialate O-acetylesterase [Bacteroides sp.]|uniref:sialate O-acetylesterase n=1 Tax=Bacteroides sp. TaxID=29523 RepID=UPI0025B8D9E8|nr:sialate O-acetylesterase [Bacteroides sp.]
MRRTIWLVLSLFITLSTWGKVKLPSIIGDNMVLQRSSCVNIWGWADPSQKVTVEPSWNHQVYATQASGDGKWLLQIQTPEAGGPYHIQISDGEILVLNDILIGEVWICSGQSNMEMPVHGFYGQPVAGSLDEIFEAKQYSGIRMFTVPPTPAKYPQENCRGSWLQSTPESVRDFSAVGYFFGKNLSRILNIPIGLITPNCGGIAIEPWMTVEAIKETVGINQELAFTPQVKTEAANASYLFNGMIAPICNYTSRGFIWYQGESNQHNYFDYDKLMTSMVKLWRKEWKNEGMPFYYVQLVPFPYDGAEKIALPLVIEAQYKALQNIPNAGIAATTDLGHSTCIHPPRKKEIGQRLAALALRQTYHIDGLLPDAPMVDKVIFEGGKAMLTFKGVPDYSPAAVGSLNFYGGELKGFEMAGKDRKFYPAKALLIQGQNKMEITSEKVPHPVAVRYAFKNYHDANVMTTEGQPLVPFRTDQWDDVY